MNTQSAVTSPIDALRWRYATKKFDPNKKISADVWEQIEEAVRLTPSSFGLQPWKFVVVTDPATKERVVPAAMNQSQPRDCSHFIVISRLATLTVDHVDDYLKLMSLTRDVSMDSLSTVRNTLNGFVSGLSEERAAEWMSRQCYIALGNLMTTAAQFGVDNCPMEGFDREAMDNVLDLPAKGCRSVVCCALGYRHEEDKYGKLAKVRFDSSRVFIHI